MKLYFITKGTTCFLVCIFMIFIAYAQQDTILELEEYELSVSRTGGPLHKTFKNVELIDKEKIRQLPVQHINELLELVSGIDVRQRSPFGVQADITIHGGSFEQTLILLNGVKINDPQTGHHNMDLPVSLDAVERIEVLKGPGARIYGQNAFSGAVNVITKVGDDRRLSLNLGMGSFDYLNTSLGISFPLKNFKQSLHLSRQSSPGYMTNTDFNNQQIFYQAKTTGNLYIYAGYQDKSFGANGFYSNRFPWQWEHTRTAFFNLTAKKGKKVSFEPSVYYRFHQDEYLLKRDTPDFYRNEHQTHILGLELRASFITPLGKTSLGYENRFEQMFSSALGDHKLLFFSLFAEHKVAFRKFTFTPGAFLGYTSPYGLQFFPGVDIGFELTKQMNAYAGIGRAFRNPSFTELYYISPADIGNPALKPEKSSSAELGFRRMGTKLDISLCGFYRFANDLIDWTRLSDSLPWTAANIAVNHTLGGEVDITFHLEEVFKSQHIFNSLKVSYNHLYSDLIPGANLTKNTLDYLKDQLSCSMNIKMGKKLISSIVYRYQNRIDDPSVSLLDFRLSFTSSFYSFYAEASNLLNVEYYEFGTIKMPGRWFRFGVALDIALDK